MKAYLPLLVLASATLSFAASPEVSNILATQRAGTKLVDIYYDVTDAEGDPLTVAVQMSSDAGSSWNIPARTLTGDVNFNVTPGTSNHIVWNAGADWNRNYTTQGKVRILADDAPTTPPVASMAFVPAGFSNPGKEIYTSAFFMDKTEVSKAAWDVVYTWAIANGYVFDNAGTATESDHPVVNINWHDAVKWCNARSEKEGLTPCYYTDSGKTTVYRTGLTALDNNWVDWDAAGYRLPTRAEWLKAYWGGNEGSNWYPWPSSGGDYRDHYNGSVGNYTNSGDPWDNGTTPVMYYDGNQVPVGVNMVNGFGLHGMFGNVSEWCWDREFTGWYSLDESQDDNSKGPNSGLGRSRSRYGYNFSNSWGHFDQKYYMNVFTEYEADSYQPSTMGFRTVRSH
jgi:formylglycine-generating enzyme required for sulfatase activity